MAYRDEIIDFCKKLLHTREIDEPWCDNGLQVEGTSEVTKIGLGVTASASFLTAVSDWGGDMAIVHHGLFSKKGITQIDGILKKRLEILLKSNISLVGFHIPLDAHPEVGNNAALVDILQLQNPRPVDCGFIAEFKKPHSFREVKSIVEQKIGTVNFFEDFQKKPIKKIGVISGASASFCPIVAKNGADLFLFGELREADYHLLKELELSFLAAGHFATERYGIQRLGERITQEFPSIEVKFFDEYCPV